MSIGITDNIKATRNLIGSSTSTFFEPYLRLRIVQFSASVLSFAIEAIFSRYNNSLNLQSSCLDSRFKSFDFLNIYLKYFTKSPLGYPISLTWIFTWISYFEKFQTPWVSNISHMKRDNPLDVRHPTHGGYGQFLEKPNLRGNKPSGSECQRYFIIAKTILNIFLKA